MTDLAIITGASAGIGAACAKAFIAHGWQVCNLSRHDCPVHAVENIQTDFSHDDWQDAVKQLEPHLKAADKICLLHNAADYHSGSMLDIDTQKLQHSFKIQLCAPIELNQAVLAHMPKGSSILYIGSTLSEKAVPGAAPYVIAKHAQLGLMRATCQDLIGKEIHTATIAPGFTDTEMLRTHLNNDATLMETIKAKSTYHRLITPSEIAELVLFAANNPVINGSLIHANLGQVER